ncbi:M48 family metalloprotease [Streptomyces sp. NPDC001796]|uniref:M48 family metalloprotease n=1 Tax=Streptomyces sp. NPDC001796 TaxID=3364609 RepID=UPI0036C1698B
MTAPQPSPPEYPGPPTQAAGTVPQQPAPPPYPQAPPPTYPRHQQIPQQPPPHPETGAAPPAHPESPQQPPAYPGPQQPPAYPSPQQPPAYPQSPLQPPAYPQTAAAPPTPTPQYPHTAPTAVPPPPASPPTAALSPDDPAHPHHISTDHGRVHISRDQRRTDVTAVGNLLLHLPNFLCSLFVVGLVSLFFGGFGIVVVLAWLASGALVFHRPTESALARHLLRLRYPTPQERAKLEPVWREVTARAGIDGRTYELWVEDSDSLNAVAAAGHIVGVTRFAMNQLPNGELAAVMAHELGHHVGGHAWSSLLGYWYALPGRVAWRFLKAFSGVVFKVSRAFGCLGVAVVAVTIGCVALATISTLYGLPLLILGVPYALAAVGRRAELRADEHAAALGFAPMLAAVLDKLHQQEQRQTAEQSARSGGAPVEESALSKLLSSHPDYHTRLHHLQPYLQPQRH